MKQTILMESLRMETRLAVIEDGQLCELYVERPNSDDGVGSIYLGRVENVLTGMNAAFVDIGTEKNGFLYAGDIQIGDRELQKRLDGLRIEKLVRPGQEILVQVVKAQSGQKGHRVSSHLTLPGRALVLLPGTNYVGVSKKITDAAARDRLYAAARELVKDTGTGMIVRTAAEGLSEDAIAREFEALTSRWWDIETRSQHAIAPKKVFSNDDLVLQCVRERLNADVDAVWADGQDLYDRLKACAEGLAPQWADRIRLHEGQMPLYDLHRVDAQLDKALRKYVWLKSGGSLVIEETEAMTVIDVNTGKYTGKKDLEETLFRLNCEAAEEIARQLRLRDIGGIVIVDFIDMDVRANNERLLECLRECFKADKNRTNVVGMTGLGLVEITRKKARRPLSRQLLHTCSDCGGDGVVMSHETTARRIVHEVWRRRRLGETNPILIRSSEPVVKWLKTIGAPDGGAVFLSKCDMKPGDYEIVPADLSSLPENCKQLK